MDKSPIKFGIGRRIATLVSVAVAATVLCVAGILASYDISQAVAMKRSAVEGIAYVFASAVADHVEGRRTHEIRGVLRSVDRVPGVISASVYDADGGTIASLGQRAVLTESFVSGDPGFWDMISVGTVPVSVGIIKNGRPVGTLVIITDISDVRTRFFQTLIAAFAASLAAALLGVMLSIPLQRRITRPITNLTATMRRLKASRDYTTDIKAEGRDETSFMVEAFNGLISDIRVRDDSLQKLAYFDPLTGLPNRSNYQKTLDERLVVARQDKSSIAVLSLNIDSFHTFNDAFGHSIGDAILLSVAAVLRDEAGASAFIARVGGDEFGIIVVDNGNGGEAETAIARIQSAFFKPLQFLGLELYVSITIGATILPRDSDTTADALRHVDLAANAAKKLGAGRARFFTHDMDDIVKSETELSQRLRFAIDNNELHVHYQPQYHFDSGRVVGYEGLLRWQHPVLGDVPPTKFVPLAEKSGAIVAIGDWVLEECCRQANDWIGQGEGQRSVAVNVSPAQILQSGFVNRVQAVLQSTGLPASLLCLELTESLFMGRSLPAVRAILDELHALGVTLALDDFGTGYSSLSYLAQLPFDKLKIDRSFVDRAHDSTDRLEILRSIIVMAHSLGMEVVAEGAETDGEIAMLRDLHADQVQGFGIARPAPSHEALAITQRIEKSAAAPHLSVALQA